MDDFSQHLNHASGRSEDHIEEQSYHTLLRELAFFLTEDKKEYESIPNSLKRKKVEIPSGLEQMLRDASTMLANTRPPANFVVYSDGTMTPQERTDESQPPIFDGTVANATPPPLGGAGVSGGAGTLLHLACALDIPLVLAFLLAMGADTRASHTAFRRLMIHEAACNGSIKCLTLLLELGKKCGDDGDYDDFKYTARPARGFDLPFLPRRFDRSESSTSSIVSSGELIPATISMPEKFEPKIDFLSMMRLFRDLSHQVADGRLSELEAARKVLESATLDELSKSSLARSCAFVTTKFPPPRSFLRPFGGTADGHGNTPLHWASFKNEIECVKLLLRYSADPNARAHPSGWTPLHDAAYSNSGDCIGLLIDAGAAVDSRANSGATPLCFAAQEDSADAAALLLERGADLTTRCAGGSIRDDAAENGGAHHPHSRFSGYTPLHYCAHYNAQNAARVLLAHPMAAQAMEINDFSDRLPIHVAVARGSADVLRALLHAGARVETRVDAPPPRSSPRPEAPRTPRRSSPAPVVSSPVLRSMIPSQPVTSTKPWNCLSQRSIDECRLLISEAERSWAPDRHSLFTPADRRAVMELLRVGKHLEWNGLFRDLWPLVLSFCGRGWFDVEDRCLSLPKFF